MARPAAARPRSAGAALSLALPLALPLALALALAAAPSPAHACRPRSGVAVHHTGRALGEVSSPTDPDLIGTPWAGPPPGVAERTSSVRPAGFASLLAMAAEGTAHPMQYHGGACWPTPSPSTTSGTAPGVGRPTTRPRRPSCSTSRPTWARRPGTA